MSRPTGKYVTEAVEAIAEKRDGITRGWLINYFGWPMSVADNCIKYLAKKHILTPESRGVYRYAA